MFGFGKRKVEKQLQEASANVARLFNGQFNMHDISDGTTLVNKEIMNDKYIMSYMLGLSAVFARKAYGMQDPRETDKFQYHVFSWFFEHDEIIDIMKRMNELHAAEDKEAVEAYGLGYKDGIDVLKQIIEDIESGNLPRDDSPEEMMRCLDDDRPLPMACFSEHLSVNYGTA